MELVNSSVGISALTDDETLAHLREWIQVKAEADAQILRGLEHFYRLREHIEYGKYAHDEIAAELSCTSGLPIAYVNEGLESGSEFCAADPWLLATRMLR